MILHNQTKIVLVLFTPFIVLATAGCSGQESSFQTQSDISSKSSVQWKRHYDDAWTAFDKANYKEMVRLLESTKNEAREAGPTSSDWGNYLTRLARAHYFAKEPKLAVPYAEEAVKVLNNCNAPDSNKFNANWFAGLAYADTNQPDKALPYLKETLKLSRTTDPGDSLKTIYAKLIECYKKKNDTPHAVAMQNEMKQRLKKR